MEPYLLDHRIANSSLGTSWRFGSRIWEVRVWGWKRAQQGCDSYSPFSPEEVIIFCFPLHAHWREQQYGKAKSLSNRLCWLVHHFGIPPGIQLMFPFSVSTALAQLKPQPFLFLLLDWSPIIIIFLQNCRSCHLRIKKSSQPGYRNVKPSIYMIPLSGNQFYLFI